MIVDLFKNYRSKIMMDDKKKRCGRELVSTIGDNSENVECSKINLGKVGVNKEESSSIKLTKGKEYIVNLSSDVIDIDVKMTEGEDVKAYIENIEKLKNKDDFKLKLSENNGIISVILKSAKSSGVVSNFNIVRNGNKISVGNGNIVIQNGRLNNCDIIESSNIAKLVVLLPSNVKYSDLTITSIAGNVDIENILVKNDIEVSSTSGDICLKDAKSKNIDVKSTSGDILLKSIKCEDSVVNSSSGDIEIVSSTIDYIGAKAMSGDIKVTEVTGEDLKLNSMSGDINVKSIECEKVDLSTMSGDIFLNNKTKLNYEIKRLKVNTMSGDKEVIANYAY